MIINNVWVIDVDDEHLLCVQMAATLNTLTSVGL